MTAPPAEQDAGDFARWVADCTSALAGARDADVPCGTCTACCRSSQFVHIAPEEDETLARIPAALLFPAPRMPAGHALLGYDEQGRCPMLGEAGCTIYEYRPRTCRTYDCRVFAATGIAPADDQPLVAERVRSWRFALERDEDRRRFEATRAAGAAVHRAGAATVHPTRLAVLAVEVHDAFLDGAEPDVDLVALLAARSPR